MDIKPKYNIIFLDMDGVINSDDYVKDWKYNTGFYNLSDEERAIEWKKFVNNHSIDGTGFGFVVPELRERVNRILREVKNAKVVWSSSWRHYVKDSKLFIKALYDQCGFEQDSFLSYTPIYVYGARNYEIIKWVENAMNSEEYSFDKFIIIDDLEEARIPEEYFENLKFKFVHTSGKTGISEDNVKEAIEFFKEN